MSQVINTNVMSMNAQRNLNKTSSSLSTALQRLSSGLRVNSSVDDAAGLAVAQHDLGRRNLPDEFRIGDLAAPFDNAQIQRQRGLSRMLHARHRALDRI